jgi:hypothetical protein
MSRAKIWRSIGMAALGIGAVSGALALVVVFASGTGSSPANSDAADELAKGEAKFALALQDPKKVALLECNGIKVYEDPQPPGHPPSAAECAQVLRSLLPAITFPPTGGNYIQARKQLLAMRLKAAPIPRGGQFDQCGIDGEGDLCKQFPELVNCTGMGPTSGTCRMAFVAPNGRFVVVSAFGWDNPSTMTLTGIGWANEEDTNHISNIIAGKAEYDSPK